MPPPKRRRSTKSSIPTAAQDHGSTLVALDPPGAIQLLAPPLLDDARLAPLEFDDFPDQWWSPASDRQQQQQQQQQQLAFDPAAVDQLLHFPEEPLESHSTLQGICAGTATQPAAPPRKRGGGGGSRSSGSSALHGVDQLTSKAISPRESHILSERERRKGMNHLFSTLAALLPDSSSKSDKSTIVSEIISYIQLLQKDLDDLAKKRAIVASSIPIASSNINNSNESESGTSDAAPDGSGSSSSVLLNACGADVFITMASAKRKNLLSRALAVMEQHKLKILDANFSSNARMSFHYFHVKALNPQLPRDALERDLHSLTAPETKIASSPSTSA